jgi:hypothetical protein
MKQDTIWPAIFAFIILSIGIYFIAKSDTPFAKHPPDAGVACSSACCECERACLPNAVEKCGVADKNTYCTCK